MGRWLEAKVRARGDRTSARVEARFRPVLHVDPSAMFSRVAGASRPRGAILALALVALAARVSLADAEASANASCQTGDACDANDAFPDGASERGPRARSPRPAHARSTPRLFPFANTTARRPRVRHARDARIESNRSFQFSSPPLPDPDASSSPRRRDANANANAVGAHVTSGSPCPPPPNGICLSLPYRADVVAPASDTPPRDCRGSFVYRAACGALKAGDAAKSVLSFFAGSARREGRVFGARPRDLTAASRLAADVPLHVPSVDVELDHSLAMVCRVRDEKTCATVYRLQRAYDDAHGEMTAASLAAEAAFDAHEATKATCEDATKKVADVDAAARKGAGVCRERVVEVEESHLVSKLRDVRESLLESRREDGGKCSRKDLFEATAALRGGDSAGSGSPRGRGKVVRVDRRLEDGTPVAVGDDENTSSIVLPNGYVMPDEYFQECGRVIEHLDAMIELLGGTQRVRENVCSEYTPAEVSAMRSEARAACSGVPERKHAYARKLEKAQTARAEVERVYGELLRDEERARRAVASLDVVIAETAAAGGNEKARAAVKKGARGSSSSGSSPSSFDAAEAKTLDDGAEAYAAAAKSSSALVAALAAYASAGASPNAAAVAAFSDAFARRISSTASTRDVADALASFARVGAAPSSAAATAANRVVASRAGEDASVDDIVAVLRAFADVRVRPTQSAFRALFAALERESPRADVADVADALLAFAAAANGADVEFPASARVAARAAVVRDAPRASPEEIADAIVAYGAVKTLPPDALHARLGSFRDAASVVAALRAHARRTTRVAGAARDAVSVAIVASAGSYRLRDVAAVLDAHAAAGTTPTRDAIVALGGAVARVAADPSSSPPGCVAAAIRAYADARVEHAEARNALVAAAAREAKKGPLKGPLVGFAAADVAATIVGLARTGAFAAPTAETNAIVAVAADAAAKMSPDDAAATRDALAANAARSTPKNVRDALERAAVGGDASRGGRGNEPRRR
jgi:hypothetical protein